MAQAKRPHPKAVGDATQAMVLARLVQVYPDVLVPFGENTRYDLVIDDGERFIKVQCKTGRIRNGAVWFSTCSSSYHHPSNRGTKFYQHSYKGEVDVFGVYCPQNDRVYVVPAETVGERACALRIAPTRNNQSKKVRWASEFELKLPG